MVAFTLSGYEFRAISAGPLFKANPSISFMVHFHPASDASARQHLDTLWAKLSDGGTALMPLRDYPFSAHYGWVQDRFGVSWQLMLTNPESEKRPFIMPSLMFVGPVSGKAEAAIEHYRSIFRNSERGTTARYPQGMDSDVEGTLMYADFTLEDQWFAAMDSAHEHAFGFNEAISLLVSVDTQEELDYYWERLSVVPEAEQCGWLKDRFGVSWQIVPTALGEMMANGNEQSIARMTRAILAMKKFDIADLRKAYEGA